MDCGPGAERFVLPADGASDVPLNIGIWLLNGAEERGHELNGPDGPVETLLIEVEPDLHTMALAELLEPQTEYSILNGYGDVTTFTTGTDVDETPPDAGVVHSVETSTRRTRLQCAATWPLMDIEFGPEAPDHFYQLEFTTPDQTFVRTTHKAPLTAEQYPCGLGVDTETDFSVRVRAWDMSGQAGEWSPSVEAWMPGRCATGVPAPWALTALVLGVLARRTSRRR